MTLPNWITVARIALVPLFIVLAYQDTEASAVAAIVVFVVASTSDFVDGHLARRRGTISSMGEFLDPLADKLLVGAALVVLVVLRPFPLWAALVIAVREVAVQLLRTRVVRSGGAMPASSAGKLKTLVQIGMVCWWLLPWDTNWGHWAWLIAAIATTLWSGWEYFSAARPVREVVS